MPELPEVETVCKGLKDIMDKRVEKVFRSEKKLRFETQMDISELKNNSVLDIKRRARYIIIDFSRGMSLLVHLGMSGKFIVVDKFSKLKHDHFALQFNDNSWLVFNDARRFGFVDLLKSKNLGKHKMLANLGPEPLSDEFNLKYFSEQLSNKKMNIKTSLMDNKIVVGVGNIYASESLFDAGILPDKLSNSLKEIEVRKLLKSIKKIIKNAIQANGSSIRDYVDSGGNAGSFQNNFKVYSRFEEKCLICKDLIKKIKQNGRSTFYCSTCQK